MVSALLVKSVSMSHVLYTIILFTGMIYLSFSQGYIQIHTDVEYDPNGELAGELEQHTLFEDDFECKSTDRDVWDGADATLSAFLQTFFV